MTKPKIKWQWLLTIILAALLSPNQSVSQNYFPNFEEMNNVTTDPLNKSILSTSAFGWGDAGGFSKNLLLDSEDGAIEFKTYADDLSKAIGFSTAHINHDFQTIEYGLFFDDLNNIWVIENGVFVINLGLINPNSVFSIVREGGAIGYEIDGLRLYESVQPTNSKLFLDFAMDNSGTGFYQLGLTFLEIFPSMYKSLNNINYNSQTYALTNSSTTNAWNNSGTFSYNQLESNNAGYI